MGIRNNGKFVVFDFETEAANVATSRPWQFAYLICQGKKIIKKENFYIWWPDLNISEGAKRITRFDYNDYKAKALPADEVLEIAEKLFNNPEYYLAGHNILGFDVLIYNVWRTSLGKKADYSFYDRIVDTLCLAKALHFDKEITLDNLFECQVYLSSKRAKGTKLTLGALCKKYEIEIDEGKMHCAFEDVIKSFEILNKLLWCVKL